MQNNIKHKEGINFSKRAIDCSLGEIVEAVVYKLEENQEIEVSTKDLAQRLKCGEEQIRVYGRAGMNKAVVDGKPCRIKRNCWNLQACMKWISIEWKKILESNRTNDVLDTRKKSA